MLNKKKKIKILTLLGKMFYDKPDEINQKKILCFLINFILNNLYLSLVR